MAISRASDSSIQDGLPKYNDIWDGTTATSAFDSLATYVAPTGGPSTITFSNIPQTYTHLELRATVRTGRATLGTDDIWMRFNGDTGNSYAYHFFYGEGSGSGTATGATSNARGYFGIAGASGGSSFSSDIVTIYDYASTSKQKTYRGISGTDLNGTVAGYPGYVLMSSGFWNLSTPAAINSITLYNNSDTSYSQFSQFSLYGIK